MATLICGRTVAKAIRRDVLDEVNVLRSLYGVSPRLGVVLVQGREDSALYVRKKRAALRQCGMTCRDVVLRPDVSQAELEWTISGFNTDPAIHGILVQLPLPGHLDTKSALSKIRPGKDVDGFSTSILGALVQGSLGDPPPLFGPRANTWPCTPLGCMELLRHYGVDVRGKQATVVGCSAVVGMPLSMMLLRAGATVTVCHELTPDLRASVASADILAVAAGEPGLVRGKWVKRGAVVLDVGINPVVGGSGCAKIVGDVEFEEASERAAMITPVPGGVGPMTVAMLARNLLKLAKRAVMARHG